MSKDLADFTRAVEELRRDLLISDVEDSLGPLSEQHYLLAIGALDTAQQYLELAKLYLAQEVAARRS